MNKYTNDVFNKIFEVLENSEDSDTNIFEFLKEYKKYMFTKYLNRSDLKIYWHYELFYNTLDLLLNCCSYEETYDPNIILSKYVEYSNSKEIPKFKENELKPFVGTIEEWLDFVEGIVFFIDGDIKGFLSRYSKLAAKITEAYKNKKD